MVEFWARNFFFSDGSRNWQRCAEKLRCFAQEARVNCYWGRARRSLQIYPVFGGMAVGGEARSKGVLEGMYKKRHPDVLPLCRSGCLKNEGPFSVGSFLYKSNAECRIGFESCGDACGACSVSKL